ncbi:MAG: glycosyltransferase family 2 protein [Roseiflexaceae bacterium]
MAQPLVMTVILNTNRRTDTLDCLQSLAQSTYKHSRIMVLDNASSDGSVAAIRSAFPAVQILELTENLGYAGNNNVGIKTALEQGADWVLVLNEDTIVGPDCLAELLRVGESDPRIGIVGPMVYHHGEPMVIQSAGGRLGRYWESQHIAQNEADTQQFSTPHAVDWISGCAILVRRALIEQVGMLDERFFYYWEETEWCLRAKRADWQILHVPQAKLWHKGVQRDYRPKPSVAYYNTRNRLFMLQKHRAPLGVQVIAWAQIGRTLTSMSIRPKWRESRAHRDAMLRGTIDFLRHRWGQGPF